MQGDALYGFMRKDRIRKDEWQREYEKRKTKWKSDATGDDRLLHSCDH